MASSETIPDQNSSDKRQDRQRFNESRRDSSTNDSDPSKVMTLEHERSSVDLRETEKGEESQRIGDLDREETSPRSSGNIKLNKEFLGPGESSGSEDDLDASLDDVERSDEDQPGSASKPKTERQLRLESEKAERAIAREGQRKMRHAREENLKSRRKEVDAGKVSDSIKRFGYLLGQTDLFRHFCDLKAQREPEFAKLLAESEKVSNNKAKQKNNQRKRKTEMEEDAELLAAEKRGDKDGDGDTINDDEPFMFTESPSYVKGGKMRDYQIQGLNWMISLFHNGINGILADEMGLGKTLQTISFLGYLKHHRSLSGPHLVVVPKSTLDNWNREFNFWVPGFNIVSLKGDKDERAEICQKKVLTQDFDIILTTYEICLREKSSLKKVAWEYIIIDEAHRIKNVDSMLSQIIRAFQSRARLLITGTPLQNNLQELWALLNFLLPDVFSSSEDFDAWFSRERTGNNGDSQSDAENSVVKQLHKVLRPFLLRRVKSDVEKSLLPKKEINVYVGMTEMQRKWYKMILEKDIDALRKCCNHPYLFDGAESPPFTTDEHLVYNSGKMIILDKLLKTMRAKGSRVLIFSQMSRVLDILEDYCVFRQYEYCRIDGSTAHEERVGAIDEYNKEGLGINLTTADIVVLFDSDWNPQADLQAMDRAHRIGQKKQVYVFRFVTENAVEEKVLERAAQKLRLDQLVIQQGRASVAQKGQTKEDLVDMIQHGAEKIINSKENMLINDDIESIIKRGEERTAELNEKYSRLDFDDLANFKTETNTQQWEGENYAANGQAKKKIVLNWIEPAKRERKMNYSENISFRDLMRGGPVVPKKKKVPKKINTSDWQFYPPRFIELQDKADLYFKKTNGIKAELPERDESDNTNPEDLEKEKQELQAEIDNAEPLTEAELEEKTEMQSLGFETWSRRDFLNFIKGCELNGRDAYDLIANEIETKNKEEVQEYSEVFWQRYEEIEDHARFISKIEQAEMKRKKADRTEELLKEKIESVKLPMQNLKIHYLNQTKGKSYSEEEDRFLLVQLHRHGIGREEVYDLIKKDIVESPLFRFDWFIKSRTPQEIMRRCNTLVQLIVKELDPEDAEELMRKRAVKAKKDNEADEGEICTTTTATATSNSNKTNGFFNSNSTNGNGISNGAPGKAAGKSRKRRTDEANSTENGNSTADLDESRASTPTTQRKKSRTSSNK
ncbi:SNF2 family N-terminal domain-domain-containing protein [Phakopsora pachyrhizi]|uniref:SNF2 family N-terminal domain-domain-containing protein n=1 Tax=Phakopsora pachyrhizi TaxID=170000 RepID=A0AAV0BA25_PHAPC|nr:SNF2 family N-terminal domain-domain-containing protein [Phakopsora pachyrhizi]